MANYELWLARDTGERITLLDNWTRIDYSITWTQGRWGTVKVQLSDVDQELLQPDRILYVYRQPDGDRLALEQAAFLRKWRWTYDKKGRLTATLWGTGANELLQRRVVAYYAASSEAEKTDNADDMMKEIVTENLLTDSDYGGTATGRAFNSAYLSVQADSGDGPSVTKGMAWRNVARVLAQVAEASRANGTPLYYRVVPTAEGVFEFRTYITRPGRDRRWPGGDNPLLFGVAYGNLADMSYEVDYTEEENYVYAGGQGDETDREIAEASSSDRINASTWNRREVFADARTQESGGVTAAADERLAEGRPRARFRADILSTAETPYGGINGWRAGDEITAVVRPGLTVDCIVEAVQVQVVAGKRPAVTGRLEVAL